MPASTMKTGEEIGAFRDGMGKFCVPPRFSCKDNLFGQKRRKTGLKVHSGLRLRQNPRVFDSFILMTRQASRKDAIFSKIDKRLKNDRLMMKVTLEIAYAEWAG